MDDPTAFERFLIDLSTRLTAASTPDVEAVLDDVLRNIGEALGTDRTALLEYQGPGGSVAATHAWARAGFEPASIGAPLFEELPWAHAALLSGAVVALAHVDGDLPAGATRDREVARASGLKSHLTVPIAAGGQLVCALSTSTRRHYCTWPDRLIDRFRLVGQIMAQALVRARPVEGKPGAGGRCGRDGSRQEAAQLRRLDEVERDHILHVIDRCGGKINGRGHAAEVLGLHPNTLRSRMKKLGIRRTST